MLPDVETLERLARAEDDVRVEGVQFISEPAERPYGIEAVFRDNSGNWFSLTQPSGGS